MSTTTNRVRRRVIPHFKSGLVKVGYFNPFDTNTGKFHAAQIQVQNVNFNQPFYSAQITMDELHAGPPYRSGGPFRTLKMVSSIPYYGIFGVGTRVRSDGMMRYVGGFGPPDTGQWGSDMAGWSSLNVNLIPESSMIPSMAGWGSKVWDKTQPRIERASGLVALAEARDIPRTLQGTSQAFHESWAAMGGLTTQTGQIFTRDFRKGKQRDAQKLIMKPKGLADKFLNLQFGWIPFLSDLKDFDNVIQNSHIYISNLTRRNDKWTRRRVTLKDDMTVVKLNSGTGVNLSPGLTNDYFSSTPTWELVEETHTKVTGVGCFKFYRPEFDADLPNFNSGWNGAMRHLAIAGVRINPSNLYRATPWSWAADWMLGIDKYIDRLTGLYFDGHATKYCYAMQSVQKIRKFRQVLPFITGGTVVLEFSRIVDTKQREVAASPFGYSLSWNSLTPRQLAIAAALGLSRI